MIRRKAPKTPEQEKGVGWTGWRKAAAVGGLALAFTGIGATVWQWLDRSGEVEGYTPANPAPALIDNRLDIGSWNMHNETAERVNQIAKVIRYARLDAMALQEVSREDLGDLQMRFPRWHMSYVIADAKAKPLDGGNGNVILSRQKPKDVESASLNGTSFLSSVVRTAGGLGGDVANADTSFKETKEGRQEDRAALAMTLQVQKEQSYQDVRIITSHISGVPKVHEPQREELMGFIEDNTNPNRPTVVAGDLNGRPETVIPRFAEIGFIVPETGPTSAGDKTIDYCAYYEAGVLGLGDADVLNNPKTDHHPIICSWQLPMDGAP